MSIQCLNGFISSSFKENWQTVNFDTIERVYYGPSNRYEKDFLQFVGTKFQTSFHLAVKFEFMNL